MATIRLSGSEADFWASYGDFQSKVVKAFEEVMSKTGRADEVEPVKRTMTNLGDMLKELPSRDRNALLKEYRNLLGFDELIDYAFTGPGMAGQGTLREIGKPVKSDLGRHVYRFNVDNVTGNPRAALLNRLSIQYHENQTISPHRWEGPGKISGLTADYWFGANIPTLEYARAVSSDTAARDAFSGGKRILVFDTETAGLANDASAVHQVAWETYAADTQKMRRIGGEDVRLKTARMQFGSIYSSGELRQIGEVASGLAPADYAAMPAGSGDEFAVKLKPLLEAMRDSDYIVGHNVGFDIGQTLQNVLRTGYYNRGDDLEFNKLVDAAVKKVNDGRVIDTLSLLQREIPDLDIADEFGLLGRRSPYSLENVILKTNLVEELEKELGAKGVSDLFLSSSSQHQADYDTRVTAKLFEYLQSGRIKAGELSKKSTLGAKIYANVLRSYAITPVTKVANVEHLDPTLFKGLVEGKYGADFKIFDMQNQGATVNLASRSADEWRNLLAAEDNTRYVLGSDVSFLEQEAWAARRRAVSPGVFNAQQAAMEGGIWRRLTGVGDPYEGMLNKDSSIFKMGVRPSEAEISRAVDAMAALGNPFAALSIPERILTNALGTAIGASAAAPGKFSSHIGAMLATDVTRSAAAQVMDDLGVLHFAAQSQFSMGKRVSLPLQVLMTAEASHVPIGTRFTEQSGKMQMLSLSPFKTAAGDKVLNLGVDMTEDQITSLADWLSGLDLEEQMFEIGDETKSLADFGISTHEQMADFITRLKATGKEYGVVVGYAQGAVGEVGYDAIDSLIGTTDRSMPKFAVPFHSTEAVRDGLSYMRTGPVLAANVMDEAEQVGLRATVSTAVNQFDAAGTWLSEGTHLAEALGAQGVTRSTRAVGKNMADLARQGDLASAYKLFKSDILTEGRRPYVAVGLLAAGVGLLALKRHRETKPYVAPFDQMPIESQGGQPRPESMPTPPVMPAGRSSLDPLATAGVTGTMYNRRDNHRVMDNRTKNDYLFNGALG